jgi:hypothetical protein
MSLGEKINTEDRTLIEASRVSRYLGYPRKVPIWRLEFLLPRICYIFRDRDNSDIALEIENMKGSSIVPALSAQEAERRLRGLIPSADVHGEITRL